MLGLLCLSFVVGMCSSQSLMCGQICDEDEVRSPICASNGVVYNNQCRFNQARCDAAKNGSLLYIVSNTDSCPAPMEPDCAKYAKNVTNLALEGPLGGPITTVCSRNYDFICTTEGTFINECEYCTYIKSIKSRAGQNFKGALGAPQSCQSNCGNDHRPVCGSDGVTYWNACRLQLAACQNRLQGLAPVREISSGSCTYVLGGQPSCDKICDEQEVRSPICASNSIVYDNQCRFNLARCDAAKNGTTLYIVSYNDSCPVPVEPNCEQYIHNTTDLALEGPVGSGVTTVCPSDYHPVCTTEGNFINECNYCQHIVSLLSSPNFNSADHKIIYNGRCHQYSQGNPFGK